MMDKTINSILTALIAVVLIASAFIPVVIKQINNLSKIEGMDSTYTTLISVVVIMTIIGIIIGVIKSYSSDSDGGDRFNEGKR